MIFASVIAGTVVVVVAAFVFIVVINDEDDEDDDNETQTLSSLFQNYKQAQDTGLRILYTTTVKI